VGFLLFSESDVSYSDFIDVKIPTPKLVTISDVFVTDEIGQRISDLTVNVPVNIESTLLTQSITEETDTKTPFNYYVQVKESTSGIVEFIGIYDDELVGSDLDFPTINWIPEKTGLYFIETFVWNKNNIPLSEQGPFVLVNVK